MLRTTRKYFLMATSLVGTSTIDSIIRKLDALHILAEPAPYKLPALLFECYCEAHSRYGVPVVEYSGGIQSFIEETLQNLYATAKDIYDEDCTRSIHMSPAHFKEITKKLGDGFYGNRQKKQA